MAVSLQVIEGVVSDSVELRAAAPLGGSDPLASGERIRVARIRGLSWWRRWWTHL